MTCIVGLVDGEDVFIGADSASACGWRVRETNLCKVFRLRGGFVLGYTTSFRMGQILRWQLRVPKQKCKSDQKYMVTVFAECVREVLIEHGFAKRASNVDSGGEFLVGYRGKLYCIASDFQVNSMADGFDAVGCGEDFALGALKPSAGNPRKRVLTALQVSAHFSGGVRGPFRVLRLKQ